MASPIESLSTELMEMLVMTLEVEDVGSLRLTSRTLETKASHGRFITFFTHKKVRLTTRDLENMVHVTSPGRLGCHLQHCTITGMAWHEMENRLSSKVHSEHTRLLANAFSNLRKHDPKSGLQSLILRVNATETERSPSGNRMSEFRSQEAIWQVAKSTYYKTVAALVESKLLIKEEFDVFGSLKGCSLEWDEFQNSLQNPPASMLSFSTLKTLKLSLSLPYEGFRGDEDEERATESDSETQKEYSSDILTGILKFLRHLPNLENLDLHWYAIRMVIPPTQASSTPPRSDDRNTGLSKMLHLKECALRGFYCSGNDLLQFVRAVSPANLKLEYVHLPPGDTYDELFEYLVQPECPIKEYHLEDICRSYDLVHYESIPGHSKFRYTRRVMGPSTLVRKAGHAKVPIRYSFPGGRPLGSGERRNYTQEKSKNFGPEQGLYDFIKLNALLQARPQLHDEDSE